MKISLVIFLLASIVSFCEFAAASPLVYPTVIVTADYNVSATDVIVLVDTTANNITVLLPLSDTIGRVVSIIDKGGNLYLNPLIIECDPSDAIPQYGSPTILQNSFTGYRYLSDGNGMWFTQQVN
jgi:hypothetical protein